MWLYRNHDIVSLWILVTLVGCGGGGGFCFGSCIEQGTGVWFLPMVFLHEDSIWEGYLQSLCYIDFIFTWCVYSDILLRFTRVCDAVHKVIGGWVPSTVVTFISVLD